MKTRYERKTSTRINLKKKKIRVLPCISRRVLHKGHWACSVEGTVSIVPHKWQNKKSSREEAIVYAKRYRYWGETHRFVCSAEDEAASAKTLITQS